MINVTKRSGKKEPLNLDKLHKVVQWACEGITGVSPSEVELRSQISFVNNMKTSDIQETLIKAAGNLISEETPNYQYVAGRLINYHLRKEVYGKFEPAHLFEHIYRVVDAGFYDKEMIFWYDVDEIETLNSYIDHDRDFDITYVGMEQFRGKYLLRNRTTKQFYETPQMAYMLIAMTLFKDYDPKIRLKYIKDYYDAISKFEVSLPTPIMAGIRTPERQFSSCVLVESDDSLDSISATSSVVIKYVSARAGLGIGAGKIRAVNSPVAGGAKTHTGVIPYYKLFQSATKSCSQGGVRGGSATINFMFWHLEIRDLLVLKNNKGTEDNRVRRMDYCVHFNKLMYERLTKGGVITLFSPSDVPGLYEAFYADQDLFRELYVKYENDPSIRKEQVDAHELFSMYMTERKETGRIYFMNVDHVNEHGSYLPEVAPISMTNLCVEITQPTKPLKHIFDSNGLIGLCTLSASNWGLIKEPKDFEKPCNLAVRALDELLSFQDYPVIAARQHTMKYRPLGVGIINFAYWLAKNDLTYQNITKEGLQLIHEYAEAWSYYLIKASVELAKEKGPCEGYKHTKYSQGILPIDTYKKTVDTIVDPVYKMDWESLRQDLLKYGIRNSTLMALMPAETSAQVSNSTNGIEPVRALITNKGSKDHLAAQVVPEFKRLKNKYDPLWEQRSTRGYIRIAAVLQKFIDQSGSFNFSYNPAHFAKEEIPMSVLLGDQIYAYGLGLKTGYYLNTNDGAGEQETTQPELQHEIIEEEDCDSCKI